MKITDLYKNYQGLILSEMSDFFATKKNEFAKRKLSGELLSKLERAAGDGKMLRGLLVLLFAKYTANKQAYFKAAAAIEIFHTGLLIQDDVMDNDTIRRGKDTFFVSLAKEGKAQGIKENTEYGKSIAMCAGDLAYFLALELLSQMDTDQDQKLLIQRLFFEEMGYVAQAQVADYTYGVTDYEPTIEEIFSVYRYKTARYTFSLPFEIGGRINGYEENTLSSLSRIGEKMGILFQIKDDELGINGNEKTFGKTIGSDIRENKKTVYRHFLFANISQSEREKISKLFGSKHLTEDDVSIIKKYMETHDIYGKVNTYICSMQKEIETDIHALSIDSKVKDDLLQVFEYVLQRDK